MLPGTELLERGDGRLANVAIFPVEEQDSGAWELRAIRNIKEGEQLVIDAQLSNLELVARGWLPSKYNSYGPTLRLPGIGGGVGLAALMEETMDKASKRFRQRWQELGCNRTVREPRLLSHRGPPLSVQLIQCIMLGIRQLESRATEMDALGASFRNKERFSKLEVHSGVYILLAEACHEASERHHQALEIVNDIEQESISVREIEVSQLLRVEMIGYISLFNRCFKQIRRRALKLGLDI